MDKKKKKTKKKKTPGRPRLTDENKELKKKVEKLKKEIAKQDKKHEKDLEERKRLVISLNEDIDKLGGKIEDLENKLGYAKSDTSNLERDINIKNIKIGELKDLVVAQAKQLHL